MPADGINKEDIFLGSFVVPILPYIVEVRIGLTGANVQSSISAALSFFGLTMFTLSPVAGILIDQISNRKWPLVLGLVAQAIATCLIATSTNSKTICPDCSHLAPIYLHRLFQCTFYVSVASSRGLQHPYFGSLQWQH